MGFGTDKGDEDAELALALLLAAAEVDGIGSARFRKVFSVESIVYLVQLTDNFRPNAEAVCPSKSNQRKNCRISHSIRLQRQPVVTTATQ